MNDVLEPKKPSFSEVSRPFHKDEHFLRKIAKTENDITVVMRMIRNIAVRRAEASRILAAFSACTGGTWTLDNVQVVLLPTFAELHDTYQFDLARLANGSGVPYAVLDMMLAGTPVTAEEARQVLQMASRIASEHWTLETVDVLVIEEEVQHQ